MLVKFTQLCQIDVDISVQRIVLKDPLYLHQSLSTLLGSLELIDVACNRLQFFDGSKTRVAVQPIQLDHLSHEQEISGNPLDGGDQEALKVERFADWCFFQPFCEAFELGVTPFLVQDLERS